MPGDPRPYVVPASQPDRVREVYEREGLAAVTGVLERSTLDAYVATIRQLIAARLQRLGADVPEGDLDDLLERLVAVDAKGIELLIRVARETLAFHQLIASPRLQQLVGAVSQLALPQVLVETCMLRIDRFEPSPRDFMWHYDAAYTAHPRQAVVCWVPLVPIDEQMGPLEVVPRSHRMEYPVRFRRDLADQKLAGPRRIELADADTAALDAAAVSIAPLAPGDLILLNGWTVHRSGRNQSRRARWVFNPRYSDLLDAAVVQNDWRLSRPGDPWVFSEYHPTLVTR